MSGSYGVAFPTAGNPYPTTSGYAAGGPAQQQPVQIQPGSITYTTTTTADGRIQYNQFRAEARSYQTAQGLVHGIQWIPVNVTYDIPPNAQPAGPDFHASWSRPGNDKESQRALKEWQREQEKRVKKEEKESAKRMKEWERERREREKAEEKELRKIQERDMQRAGRSGRLSDTGYSSEVPVYSSNATGYSRARSRSRVRRDSVNQDELARAMAEMAMDNEWTASEPESRWEERERRARRISINERPRRISTHEYERARKTSGTPYPYFAPGAPGYGAPGSPGRTYSNRASPYMGGGALPPSVPVYPPGHIYAGKPIPGALGQNPGGVISSYRAPSPSPGRPYRVPSPSPGRSPLERHSSLQLELPLGFSRPPSLAASYTYFDIVTILPDLNKLSKHLPPRPAVLGTHDVWPDEWIQCFEDIARTWLGKWPDRKSSSRKPYKTVAELIDVWNASFFSLRGVELILSRGRQRLSGPHAGHYDSRFDNDGSSDEESDTISSVSSDSDTRDRYEFYGSSQARYGTGGNPWLTDSREARRAHKEKKLLEKQKKKQRQEREKEKEKGSRYTLYLSCIGNGQPPLVTHPAAYHSAVSAAYPI